ncbi:uncharacterized protein [Palaemon carinicauda]|uniref:uncharacterized protein n=1 Tax=Palaemon carinicauda TaxID=392227 RepID=UPI0035B6839C
MSSNGVLVPDNVFPVNCPTNLSQEGALVCKGMSSDCSNLSRKDIHVSEKKQILLINEYCNSESDSKSFVIKKSDQSVVQVVIQVNVNVNVPSLTHEQPITAPIELTIRSADLRVSIVQAYAICFRPGPSTSQTKSTNAENPSSTQTEKRQETEISTPPLDIGLQEKLKVTLSSAQVLSKELVSLAAGDTDVPSYSCTANNIPGPVLNHRHKSGEGRPICSSGTTKTEKQAKTSSSLEVSLNPSTSLGTSGHKLPTLPEVPHQPPASCIPLQKLKNKTLRFQSSWYNEFPWLHFHESIGGVLCHTCVRASPQRLSDFARYQLLHDQHQSRAALIKIITTLKYLAEQGLAIRGHETSEGNFAKLLQLRAEDDKKLKVWLSNKVSYTSVPIQNEILKTMANAVVREICNEVNQMSTQFGLITDGTHDIQGNEQEAVCVRYVDDKPNVHEELLGLYQVSATTGVLLSKMLQDTLISLQLPIQHLRAQTYDGASNMSGKYKGCQAEIKKVQPLALYVHCGAHVTHLIISKAIPNSLFIKNALDNLQELGTLYRSSGKFKHMYLNIHTDDLNTPSPTSLKPICPTRWLTRYAAVKAVLDNYPDVLAALQEAAKELGSTTASRAAGLYKCLSSGECLLGLYGSLPLIQCLENFNKSLQGSKVTVSGMLEAAEVTIKSLQSLRCEHKFKRLFEEAEQKLHLCDLDAIPLPRKKKNTKEQLDFFHNQFKGSTVEDCRKIFADMVPEVRRMFPQVEALLRLLLVSPASSCTAERVLFGISLYPVADVEEAYEDLTDDDEIPGEFISYFDVNYMGVVRGHGRKRRREPPLFPMALWNVNSRDVNNLPRTNNALKGYHSSLKFSLGGTYPNI